MLLVNPAPHPPSPLITGERSKSGAEARPGDIGVVTRAAGVVSDEHVTIRHTRRRGQPDRELVHLVECVLGVRLAGAILRLRRAMNRDFSRFGPGLAAIAA